MRKNILYAFLFVFLSFTLISCGNGNLVDETASNTTPDASIKEILSISAVSTGGTSYKFTPNVSGASLAELTFKWTFGDGIESTEQSPTHEYSVLGMKTVTLTTYKGEDIWKTTSTAVNVTDSGSITGTDIIAKPAIDGITYTFTSRAVAADGGDLEFNWDFNEIDGSTQTGTNLNNVSHVFSQYGRDYNVVLTVTNKVNGDVTKTNTVVSTPKPTFSFDVTAGALPGSKVFTPNLSIDIPGVEYKWDFGDDNSSITTPENPNAEHYYGNYQGSTVTVTCTVTSPNLAEPLVYTKENINVTINFQLFGATNTVTSDDKLSYKYTVKGAFQGDDTTKINNVSYRFIYPDGSKSNLIAGSPVQDGSSTIAGQSYAEDNHTYARYYKNYAVSVEAVQVVEGKETVLGTISEGLSHNYVAPTYTITSSSDTDPLTITFVAGGDGFYELKDAVYRWNFGDGKGEISGGSSISNKYTSNGKFNVTLKVTSPHVTFDNAYTASTTVNVNESLSNVSFECNPTNNTEWLKYTCSTNASSSTGTLVYTWKVNNQVVQQGANSTLEKTFDKYNTSYNVDLVVNISGTTISETAERKTVTTPKPVVEINGSTDVLSGVSTPYNLKFKVTRNGQQGYIEFPSPTISWTFGGTLKPEYANKAEINHAFIVNENEGKTVVRIVSVTVGSSNMTGNITNTKNVTVTKPTAEMSDIINPTIVCNNDSAWNVVKKKCYVDFSFKEGTTNKDKEQFRVSIVDAGGLNQPQIKVPGTADNATAALTLTWPDGDIVTGKSASKTFTINGKIYKKDGDPNNNIPVSTQVTVANYVDYVLFPMPKSATYGGTGSRIGAYSCGYNTVYSTGNGQITNGGECTEANSASKRTLNLGGLVNNDVAQVYFVMNWKVRLRSGTVKTIKTVKLNKGETLTDDMKKFDITDAFSGYSYVGEVYDETNDSKGMFYLEITDALSVPLKVWYTGRYKTDKGNRLIYLAPIMETSGHSCNSFYKNGKNVTFNLDGIQFRGESGYFASGKHSLQTLMFSGTYSGSCSGSIGGTFNQATVNNNKVSKNDISFTACDGANSATVSFTAYMFSNYTGRSKTIYKNVSCSGKF